MSKTDLSDEWNLPRQVDRVLVVGGLAISVTFSVVGLVWMAQLARGRLILADPFFASVLMPLLALIPIGSTVLLTLANRFPSKLSVRAAAAAALCWPFLPLAGIGWNTSLWLAFESLTLATFSFAIILFCGDVIEEWLDKWLKSLEPEPETESHPREPTPPASTPAALEPPRSEPEPPASMPLSDVGKLVEGCGWLRWNGDAATGDLRYEGGDAVLFSPGQKRAVWHIAFQRPFDRPPQFDLEIADGDDVRWQVGGVFPYGVRIEFRRSTGFETELRVRFEFAAFPASNDESTAAA
jgi:hypothetical protein